MKQLLTQSMIDRENNEKESSEIEIYNHYPDEGNSILKNTQFKVEDIFGYFLGNEYLSLMQIFKPNSF